MEERKVQLNKLQNIIWSDVKKNREKGIHNLGGYICLDESVDEDKLKECAYLAITMDDVLRMQLDENDEFYIAAQIEDDIDSQEEPQEEPQEELQLTEELDDDDDDDIETELQLEFDGDEEVEIEKEPELDDDELDTEIELEIDKTEEIEVETGTELETAEYEEELNIELDSVMDEVPVTDVKAETENEVEEEKIETFEFGNEERFFNDMKERLEQSFIKPHSPLIKAWFVKSLGQNYLCIAAHGLVADEQSIKQMFADIMKMYYMDESAREKYVENKRLGEDTYIDDFAGICEDEEKIKEMCENATFCHKVPVLLDKDWIMKEHTEKNEADEYVWHIKHEVFTGIKQYEENHELLAENIFMAAVATFVNQVTGSSNIVVSKSTSNRDETKLDINGRFAYELPLVLSVDENDTFLDVCENIARENTKLEELASCSMKDLLEYCGWEGQLTDIAIAFDKEKALEESWRGVCKGSVNEAFCGYAQIPLTIRVCEKSDRFTVKMQYQKDAYESYQIEQLSLALEYILRNACKRTTLIRDVVLGENNNLSRISGKFEAREEFLPTVIEAFFERVDRNPYEISFAYEEDGRIMKMDYKIAGDCVCAVATYLTRNGVERGDIVGVHMKRGVLMPLTILATFLVEATILPIDIDGDEQANKKYYDMCKFVVTDEFYEKEGKEILEAKGQLKDVDEQSLYHCPKDIAYYVKKGCSNGEEKLVAISHNSLAVRLNWHSKLVGTAGVFIQKCKNIYDTAMLELLYPCYVGATLYMLPDGKERDMSYIADKIEELSITHIHFTPTMLEEFIESDSWEKLSTLKYLMLSDEVINPISLLTFKENRPSVKVYNMYGPVECTIDVTAYECNGKEENVPLGNIADKSYIYIVNKDNKAVPKGFKGEILLAGALLGDGYYQCEEEEGDFFTENNIRYYRTGDYGWVDDDGVLHYAGRKDSQIKVAGVSISNTVLEHKALESRLVTHAMADYEDGKWVLYYQKKNLPEQDASEEAKLGENTDIYTAVDMDIATETDTGTDAKVDIELETEEVNENETVSEVVGLEEKLAQYIEEELPWYYHPSEYYEVETFAIADNGKTDRRKMVNDRWRKLRGEDEPQETEYDETEADEELEVSSEVEADSDVEVESEVEVEMETRSESYVDTADEQDVLYFKRDGANNLLIAIPYAAGKPEDMEALIDLYEYSDILVPNMEFIGKKTKRDVTEMYRYLYELIRETVYNAQQKVTILGYCVGSVFAMGLYEYLSQMNIPVGDLVFCGSLPVFSFEKQGEASTVWDYAPDSMLNTVLKILGLEKSMSKERAELFRKEVRMAAKLLKERKKKVMISSGHRLILVYGNKDKITLSWPRKYKQWGQYLAGKVSVKCLENCGHYDLLDYMK